ncbi:hypothetical protein DCAR_0208227 [Daucus carota subsp. sativus]|uniref:Uncharacterized protein n=1 Tax=Daucus carota subsp. sativus TaxID=79200 RepID=A0AAF0WG89_DAUCS|nr:hypothetical protein DCAR_0208227 [Daucus carota subsp. sativus]
MKKTKLTIILDIQFLSEPGSKKSCRLRSMRNDTRPELERENFGEDEEDLIIKLHALLGNRWSLIAGRLPGRTDKEVENYWNSHLKGELVSSGIDPDNHRIHHTLPRSKNKNQIPVISSSDDSSTCATSAVSKPLKYQDQSYKMHHLSNGTDNLELSFTCDTKAPDLCAELPIINLKPHAGPQEKK